MGLSVWEMTGLLLYPASVTRSMLTFKLLPRCRLGDEQKCHCVMTNKQCLYRILMPPFIGHKKKRKKDHLHFRETWAGETPGTHEELLVWRSEMWHHAMNKSQSLEGCPLYEQPLAHTHTSPAAICCLSSMYPSNSTSPPVFPSSLSERTSQGWQTAVGPNQSLSCGGRFQGVILIIIHHWLHTHTALWRPLLLQRSRNNLFSTICNSCRRNIIKLADPVVHVSETHPRIATEGVFLV